MLRPSVFFALALFVAVGCATPIAPSGGPADTTPPALEAAKPAAGAVNVRADRLELTFSENIDEGSAVRALSIVPEWETPPEVIVRGRRIEVVFPDALRPNTTYVVGFDTNLKDLRNVALRQPITFAFATGPTLDRGQIAGRVLDPQSGSTISGMDIFAYALTDTLATDSTALPDVRTAPPDYRTQTGEGGTFTLDYLRPEPFFVVAVNDLNRNRRVDSGEAFAVPFEASARAVAPGDTLRTTPTLRFFRTRIDSTRAAPLRVRTRSSTRFAVRFDEPIVLRDRSAEAWSLVDSVAGQPVAIREVYADDDPQQIVLTTEPLAASTHHLWLADPAAVADSSGNPAQRDTLTFTPSPEPDTLGVRFVGFLPEETGTLSPLDTVGVRFNAPPDAATLARIAVTDTLDATLPASFVSRDGVRYRLVSQPAASFRIAVPEPDSTYTRQFDPLSPDALGELTGIVVTPGSGRAVVEAVAGDDRYVAVADATGAFALTGLPEGDVRLRLFLDLDGDEQWDGGRLAPYAPPEPIRFLDATERVRPRWETVVDTLTIE